MHTQHPLKLNVWAGIFEDRIIGPIFLDGNLTNERYLGVLQDTIQPLLLDIVENDNRYLEDHLIFQQDGAPPHYALAVREYLERAFPEHWIGRRGVLEWLARSPDFKSSGLFLVGSCEKQNLRNGTRVSVRVASTHY